MHHKRATVESVTWKRVAEGEVKPSVSETAEIIL